jgi:N6-adenosine-specific RNA methylase IME4
MRQLRPDRVDALGESIHQRGLLQPIGLQPYGDGYRVVFGVHRFEAAKRLGHESIEAIILDGLDADAALLAEIDENLIRADLSPAERAMHLAERKRIYEKLHPETKSTSKGGVGRAKQTRRQNGDESVERFTKDVAKKTGKSERTIQREVERGTIVGLADVPGTSLDAPDELDALVKLPEPVQRDLIARAKVGEMVTPNYVAQRLRRESRERELGEATEAASQALGRNLYGVILADPPWRFEPYSRENGLNRAADNHYPTMTADAIKALLIPASNGCVLFLWATVPMLPRALDVMSTWGFAYRSAMFWKKDREGTGHWLRNTVEILLIGTKGDVPAPTPGQQPPQMIQTPRERHSEKPAIFAEHIERLLPNVPKLEMFAREARPGWDVWGNEIPRHQLTTPATEQGAKVGDGLDIPDFLLRDNAPDGVAE